MASRAFASARRARRELARNIVLTELHRPEALDQVVQLGENVGAAGRPDTSTPSGRAMFQMMGVFAEFERAMIRERVLAGLARAKRFRDQSGPSAAGSP